MYNDFITVVLSLVILAIVGIAGMILQGKRNRRIEDEEQAEVQRQVDLSEYYYYDN